MTTDTGTLFTAGLRLREALESADAMADEEAAAEAMLGAAREGCAVLKAIARDDELWDRLVDQEPLSDPSATAKQLWARMDEGWDGRLERLGRMASPPVDDLGDVLLANAALAMGEPWGFASMRRLDALRADLLASALALSELLVVVAEIPVRFRRRSLRRPLLEHAEDLQACVLVDLAVSGPFLAPAVASSVRTSGRRWTRPEARHRAQLGTGVLVQVLGRAGTGPANRAQVVEGSWLAETPIRRLALEEDRGFEVIPVLREIRARSERGIEIPRELRAGIRNWEKLPRGWLDGVVQREAEGAEGGETP